MDLLTIVSQLNQENILELFKNIFNVYILYTSSKFIKQNKEKNKFKIHKMPKSFRYSDVLLPPEIVDKELKLEKKYIMSKCFKDELLLFCNTLSNKFKPDDLRLFYNNLKQLKIKKYIFHNHIVNCYNAMSNTIKIDKKEKNVIYHELFHMASSIGTKNRVFIGFRQFDLKECKEIGNGLNEGYTEYMTLKYFFNVDYLFKSGYWVETIISSQLEKIIGNDKMESLYMQANLLGLISELEKYNTKDKIIEFLQDLDLYSGRGKLGDLSKSQNKYIIEKHLKNINKFLCTTYFRKISSQLVKKQISDDDFSKLVQDFSSSLIYDVTESKFEYDVTYKDVFSIDILNEIVKEIFGNNIKIDTKEPTNKKR